MIYGQCPSLLADGTQCQRSARHRGPCKPLRKAIKAGRVRLAAKRTSEPTAADSRGTSSDVSERSPDHA